VIAIDTNVLLRYLLQDDAAQSLKATKLLAGRQPVLITDVVLVETLWTLKGKKYKLPKQDLVTVLSQLMQEPNVVFEDSQTVWTALQSYHTAATGNGVDFADTLILAKSQYAIKVKNSLFDGLYTFDADLQMFKGAKKP